MKEEHRNNQCKKVLNNEHIAWCECLNKPNDFRDYHILNGEGISIYTNLAWRIHLKK